MMDITLLVIINKSKLAYIIRAYWRVSLPGHLRIGYPASSTNSKRKRRKEDDDDCGRKLLSSCHRTRN